MPKDATSEFLEQQIAAPLVAGIVDCVVIGRNEGERLKHCLLSLQNRFRQIVYVDSGSQDESVKIASELADKVVRLDPNLPFTAARARNEGIKALSVLSPDFVQLIDGDCVLQPDWLDTARSYLAENPEVAVVCGRRWEIAPENSVFNRLVDIEWDTPVGPAKACGGDALFRFKALSEVGGFVGTLIAGEEPELCIRIRQNGWLIQRLDAQMTEHDADMTKVSQWAARTKRAGYAFAQGATIHGAAPEFHWKKETRRALIWGFLLPIAVFAMALITPWALALLLVYPMQVLRLAARRGVLAWTSWEFALFTTLGKFLEAAGVFKFYWGRITARRAEIIEYKTTPKIDAKT